MLRKLELLRVCLVFVVGCSSGIHLNSSGNDDALSDVLHAIGLDRTDLTIDGSRLADPDRLDTTISLLRDPLDAPSLANSFARADTFQGVEGALAIGRRLLGLALGSRIEMATYKIPEPPAELSEILGPLISELLLCRSIVEGERAKYSPEAWRALQRLPLLVHPERSISEWEADTVIVLARQIDIGLLTAAAERLAEAVDRFQLDVRSGRIPVDEFQESGLTLETTSGVVVIGGRGNDVHTTHSMLLVDLGGDDRYEASAGVASEKMPVSVCIDLAGNDTYLSAHGRGMFGIGLLLDVEGDDSYNGNWGSQGCGIGGVGILQDQAGDDLYQSGFCGQGFGLYGIGLLVDTSGSDRYEGNLLNQGASGPGGFGGLFDRRGDDHYTSGGRYPDFREEGAFLSMSQGFSMGVRPLASGGASLLLDGEGDDQYHADYFAQGAADWGGTGMLIDSSGNDVYTARRYAQGCGTHLAVGLLLDEGGNDQYTLWGVGQGCGHDLSVGMLNDLAGDDRYRGSFLCQGAGNANGIGMLEDFTGHDEYFSEQDDCRGFGNPFRDYGSIGLFLDHNGTDRYSGPGANGRLWTGGRYGAGTDLP